MVHGWIDSLRHYAPDATCLPVLLRAIQSIPLPQNLTHQNLLKVRYYTLTHTRSVCSLFGVYDTPYLSHFETTAADVQSLYERVTGQKMDLSIDPEVEEEG